MTMRSLGLSIYPGHSKFEGNAHYLDLARKYGFSRIFMSMLEVQGSPEGTKAKYKKIIEYGNKLGFQTFLDVNPAIFKQLGVSYDDLKFLPILVQQASVLTQHLMVQLKQCFLTTHMV